MVNKWELFYGISSCGSGTYEELNYVLNDSGTVVRYGTRQIPCSVPDRNVYMRDSFISALREHMGLTDADTIYTNGVLFYQPPIPTITPTPPTTTPPEREVPWALIGVGVIGVGALIYFVSRK